VLKCFAETQDRLFLNALSKIFQFLTFDAEFVYELGDANFLSRLKDAALKLNDVSIYKIFAYIVTTVAQIGFVTDIVDALNSLLPLIGGELGSRVIPLCEICMKYPACREAMKKSQLPAKLMELLASGQLLANPALARTAGQLLDLLKND
jgi:hypothetical protein